jgi:hypothetical protein
LPLPQHQWPHHQQDLVQHLLANHRCGQVLIQAAIQACSPLTIPVYCQQSSHQLCQQAHHQLVQARLQPVLQVPYRRWNTALSLHLNTALSRPQPPIGPQVPVHHPVHHWPQVTHPVLNPVPNPALLHHLDQA